MIQEQIVDYISSQLKLGVSRDAVKTALVSAGWVAADVEDTLKKVDGGTAVAQPAAMSAQPSVSVSTPSSMSKPVGSSPSFSSSPTIGSSPMSSNPTSSAAKSGGPQMIRVSDLVSTSSSSPMKTSGASFGGKISGNTFQAASTSSMAVGSSGGGKGSMMGWMAAAVFFIGFGGLAWYFYSQNAGLAAKVSTLTAQSASVTAELGTLQSQINTTSTDSIATQVASLSAANADLAMNLSFYAMPVGSTSTAPQPVTVSGWLSGGGKAPYTLTTPRGAKVFISSATSASVLATLKPLVGDTVQVMGMYVPGSDTVTATTATNLSTPAAPTSTTMTTQTTTVATTTATSTK